jgi:hypothetical protein
MAASSIAVSSSPFNTALLISSNVVTKSLFGAISTANFFGASSDYRCQWLNA